MEYFSKWLPVKGEIKEGDNILWGKEKMVKAFRITDNKWYVQTTINSQFFPIGQFKKVKLFLCSRDIQVGDIIKHPMTGEDARVIEIINGWIRYGKHPNEVGTVGLFKVIGEISPEAIWVKEGDEFDSADVMDIFKPKIEANWKEIYKNEPREGLNLTTGEKKIVYPYSPTFSTHNWKVLNPQSKDLVFKIKGPCGHFH